MNSRKWWLKTHRLVGLYSVVFVLILALSGLVLSFSDFLKLDDRSVFNSNKSLSLDDNLIRLKADQLLINDTNTKARCIEPVVGVIGFSDNEDLDEYQALQGLPSVKIVCQNIIYWMSWAGDIFDSINIPKKMRPIHKSYFQDRRLIFVSDEKKYYWHVNKAVLINDDAFSLTSDQLPQLDDKDATSMAQFFLNVHTGLIAGDIGRNLMRLATIGLIFLCLSGLKNGFRRT